MKKQLIIIGCILAVFAAPFVVRAIQAVPTNYSNNITGRLLSPITVTQTTGITITADTYRTPAGQACVTFPTGNMILKLSRVYGNVTWIEYIAVESASQSSCTVTLGTTTRYLSSSDGSDFTSQGNGLAFPSGTIVELVWSTHQAEGTMFKSAVNVLTGSGRIAKTGSSSALVTIPGFTTAEIAAMKEVNEGDVTRDETLGVLKVRLGNAWNIVSGSGVTNAGYNHDGKVRLARPDQTLVATASGSTGAPLVIANKDVIVTSSGSTSGRVTATDNNGYLSPSVGGTGTGGDVVSASGVAIFRGTQPMKSLNATSSGQFIRADKNNNWIVTSSLGDAEMYCSSVADSSAITSSNYAAFDTSSCTIPAGTLRAGDVVEVSAYVGGSNDTSTYAVRFDGKKMADLASSTDGTALLESKITIRTVGTSGSIRDISTLLGDAVQTAASTGAVVTDTAQEITIDLVHKRTAGGGAGKVLYQYMVKVLRVR